MTDRPRDLPASQDEIDDAERTRRDKTKGPKHVLDTALPPGISVDEAKDPGEQSTPAKPAVHSR